MDAYYLKNGQRIIIRDVMNKDASDMVKFWNQIGGETDNLTFGSEEFYFNDEQERCFIESLKQRDNCLYVAAFLDGHMIGCLSFLSSGWKRVMHRGDMEIGILKEYWNLGAGSNLMEYFLRWVNSRGTIKKVDLDVREDNIKAINLYLKYGFKIEGRISKGMYIDNKFYDLYHMGKTIG